MVENENQGGDVGQTEEDDAKKSEAEQAQENTATDSAGADEAKAEDKPSDAEVDANQQAEYARVNAEREQDQHDAAVEAGEKSSDEA